MDFSRDRIAAAQHILASIFASQKALQVLAPEYRWAGLGNLLGDFGELVGTDHYKLTKAASGSGDYDATDVNGRSVQIKTNYAASQIGFRGHADLMLVINVKTDGTWEEVYFGPFDDVKRISRYSSRDNKNMVAVSRLRSLKITNSPALIAPLPSPLVTAIVLRPTAVTSS